MIEVIVEIKSSYFKARIRDDMICHSRCAGRGKETLRCQMGDPFGIALDGHKGKPVAREECREAARGK